MTKWWLSFVDGALPEGTQFLGVAVVEADCMVGAADRAWKVGCNPGGEVMGFPIDDALAETPAFAATPLDTLMDRATLARLGHVPTSLGEMDEDVLDALTGETNCDECAKESAVASSGRPAVNTKGQPVVPGSGE